jgi:hypothetical protein
MFLDGDFFEGLCNKKYPCDVNIINDGDIVYCATHNIINFFDEISKTDKKIKLLTHNSDTTIFKNGEDINIKIGLTFNNKSIKINIPNNIKKWYGQNMNIKNDNFFVSLPIGLERKRWSNGSKHDIIFNMADNKLNKDYLLYSNFTMKNNSGRRILHKFKNIDWCLYRENKVNFNVYCNEIKKSNFILSPIGNGLDCHRTWESIYLGSIPIVEKNHCMESFKDLPILIVNSFNDINKEMLIDYLSDIKNKNFDMSKLKKEYYYNII